MNPTDRILGTLVLAGCLALATTPVFAQNGNADASSSKPASKTIKITWDALGLISYEETGGREIVTFDSTIHKMVGKKIEIQGFMVPLEQGRKQKTFVLSKIPFSECYYCTPDEAKSMAEVRMRKPMGYRFTPVLIRGTLQLLKNDPLGLLYRLRDAEFVM